jgi:hypothetical protein
MPDDEEEFWGGVSSWTEPHAPLPRRRPIVHGFVGLPIVVPTGDDILILLVLDGVIVLLPSKSKQTQQFEVK